MQGENQHITVFVVTENTDNYSVICDLLQQGDSNNYHIFHHPTINQSLIQTYVIKPNVLVVDQNLLTPDLLGKLIVYNIPILIQADENNDDGSKFYNYLRPGCVVPVQEISLKLLRDTIKSSPNAIASDNCANQSSDLFHSIVDKSCDAIFVCDTIENRFLVANQALCNIFGYTKEELLAKSLFDIFSDYQVKAFIKSLIEKNSIAYIRDEIYYRNQEESETPLEITLKIIQHNHIQFVLGTVRDISEIKASRLERELFTIVLETINSAHSSIDVIDEILRVIKEYTGVSAIRILQRQKKRIVCSSQIGFPDSYNNDFTCKYTNLLNINMGMYIPTCLVSNVLMGVTQFSGVYDTERGSIWTNIKDSSRQQFSSLCSCPYKDNTASNFLSTAIIPIKEKGEITGLLQLCDVNENFFNKKLVNLLEDIVSSLNYSIEKDSYKKELLNKNRRYKEIASRLETKNKEIEELIFIASHDLRSPLVSIMGFTKEVSKSIERIRKLVEDCNDDSGLKESIIGHIDGELNESMEFIYPNIIKMDKLIANLIRISRVSTAEMNIKKLDIKNVIDKLINIFENEIKEKNITVEIGYLPNCYGDEVLISQIFYNLIDNAIKFSSKKNIRRILIFGQILYGCANYVVEDNGQGIKKSHQQKIFDLFYKLENNDFGDGVGLPLAKKMIEKLGGTITLSSVLGKGSQFQIKLKTKLSENESSANRTLYDK